MSLAAALRDARRIGEVWRAQGRVLRRYGATPQGMKTVWTRLRAWWFGGPIQLWPVLVPVWVLVASDKEPPGSHLWRTLAALVALLFTGAGFPFHALRFSAVDVLRQPSKAGVLMRRILDRVPGFLFTGACWAGAYAILLVDDFPSMPFTATACLLAALLAPFAGTVGKLVARLRAEPRSVTGPLCVPVLAGFSVDLVLREASGGLATWVFVAFLTLLGLGALAVTVRECWRHPRAMKAALGTDLAILPQQAGALGLLVIPVLSPSPAELRVLSWGALGLVVTVALLSLGRLMSVVRHAEEKPAAGGPRTVDELPTRNERIPVALPTTHRGRRSLLRAELLLHRYRCLEPGTFDGLGKMLRELPGLLVMGVYHAWGVVLAVLAVDLVRPALALLAGMTAPGLVRTGLRCRLHLLGVDYLDQLRSDVRAVALFAGLPVVAAALLTGTVAGWTGMRGLTVATLVAGWSLRAGWRGLVPGGEVGRFRGEVGSAALALLVLTFFLPLATWGTVLAAAAVGAAGILRRLFGRRESGLADQVRRLEEAA